MRIAIDLTSARAGGGLSYAVNVVPAMAKCSGNRHRFVVYLTRGQRDVHRALASSVNVSVVDVPVERRALRYAWQQVLLPLHLLRVRPDVFFSPVDTSTVLLPCPLVIALRNLNVYERPADGRGRVKQLVRYGIARAAVRRAARVIFPSRSAAQAISARIPVDASATRVVHHGVPERFFRTEDHGDPPWSAGPYVLFVSTIAPHKNVEMLLDAYARVRETGARQHLLIVGRAAVPVYFDRLVARAEELGLGACVHFLGEIPNEELADLYAGADAFVFPSSRETFGIPVLEAMAAGAPVVAADIPSVREIAGDAAELVPPGAADAMARALAEVLGSETVAAGLRRRGWERARRFRWSATAEGTLRVIEEAVDAGRRVSAAGSHDGSDVRTTAAGADG